MTSLDRTDGPIVVVAAPESHDPGAWPQTARRGRWRCCGRGSTPYARRSCKRPCRPRRRERGRWRERGDDRCRWWSSGPAFGEARFLAMCRARGGAEPQRGVAPRATREGSGGCARRPRTSGAYRRRRRGRGRRAGCRVTATTARAAALAVGDLRAMSGTWRWRLRSVRPAHAGKARGTGAPAHAGGDGAGEGVCVCGRVARCRATWPSRGRLLAAGRRAGGGRHDFAKLRVWADRPLRSKPVGRRGRGEAGGVAHPASRARCQAAHTLRHRPLPARIPAIRRGNTAPS